MHVIRATGVNDAVYKGVCLIEDFGTVIAPRGVVTLECPFPVTTEYEKPTERVLFNSIRDANPFFHAMEAMWILAGRDDVQFLTQFNKRMIDFSDDGVTFHAPYGHRLRFGSHHQPQDQLKGLIRLFAKDINTRRGVLQIWNSLKDLNANTKDTPCNDLIFVKVRDGKLNITVCNRSNDMIWGAYGANIVQFSTIQEYLAAMLGVEVGTYYQVSDSFHAYPDNPQWDKLVDWANTLENPEMDIPSYDTLGVTHYPLVADPHTFDYELTIWFTDPAGDTFNNYSNKYLDDVAIPMYRCWKAHKNHKDGLALVGDIKASDWRLACQAWLMRREHTSMS